MEFYDLIVIGGGIIGLSSAYYAASAGKKTLLLEQGVPLHDLGGSSPGTRFFRVMHSEPNLVRLAEASYALWRQIEYETESEMISPQPLLFLGERASDKTVEGDFSIAHLTMNKLGVPYRELQSDQIQAEYSGFKKIPPNYVGLIQNNSGIIRVETCLTGIAKLARAKGATIVTSKKASIIPNGGNRDTYTVTTNSGDFQCREIVIAAGAWTNNVLSPLGVKLDLKIWQMTIGYFEVDSAQYRYPFWYEFGRKQGENTSLFYGFPASEEIEGCVKLSADFTFDYFDDVNSCTRKPCQKILGMIAQNARARFHGINVVPRFTKTCLYSMSPDYGMIVDRLPGYDRVAIFAGESGRGFKFAPILGRILCELAAGGESWFDLSEFSIKRGKILLS